MLNTDKFSFADFDRGLKHEDSDYKNNYNNNNDNNYNNYNNNIDNNYNLQYSNRKKESFQFPTNNYNRKY